MLLITLRIQTPQPGLQFLFFSARSLLSETAPLNPEFKPPTKLFISQKKNADLDAIYSFKEGMLAAQLDGCLHRKMFNCIQRGLYLFNALLTCQ